MSRSARQSVYPQPPPSNLYWQALDSISHSLYSASSNLNSACATLHQGTYDFPRCETVFASKRAFEIVTETEVHHAQRELASQVEPQVKELIQRAEDGLEDLKRKEKVLRGKVEKRAALQARPPPPVDHDAREAKLAELRKQKGLLSREGKRLDEEGKKLKREMGIRA